jgi:hypothetical protein
MAIPLKIIFWNVWCLPFFATDGTYSDVRARNILNYIAEAKIEHDLFILNEAWTTDAKDVFKAAYPYSYQTGKLCCKLYDSGLLILSKVPILNPSYILYSKASDWDWFVSKGALHFQIQTSKGLYDFFTTHMQAGFTDIDQEYRPFQFVELIKFINANMPKTQDVFFIGDLNVMPLINGNRSGHTQNMDDALFRSACYYTIPQQTGMIDLQKGQDMNDVVHFFCKRSDPIITKHDQHGLTDGPFYTLEIPV